MFDLWSFKFDICVCVYVFACVRVYACFCMFCFNCFMVFLLFCNVTTIFLVK